MRGVRPLADRTGRVPPPRPAGAKPARPAPLLPPAPPLALDAYGDHVEGRADGVSRDRLRALQDGDPAPQDTLDLHGLRRDEATRRLETFIGESHRRRLRCVLVVTGRGAHSGDEGPVLRTAVVHALADEPLRRGVLAFVSAPPAHGGAGALLVLLRRV